jgi:hypothetical protein
MNGENNHIFHTSAPDGQPLDPRPPRFTWTLFAAQLWLLAAFVGMSLVGIAAKQLLGGVSAGPPAAALAAGFVGAVLVPVAWRNVARQLGRAERESAPADGEPEPATAPDRVVPAKALLLASHR